MSAIAPKARGRGAGRARRIASSLPQSPGEQLRADLESDDTCKNPIRSTTSLPHHESEQFSDVESQNVATSMSMVDNNSTSETYFTESSTLRVAGIANIIRIIITG